MKTLLRALILLAAISLVVTVGLLAFDFYQAQEKFPYETFIGGVNVSGLDEAQAYEKLTQLKVGAVYSPVVTFEADNQAYTFPPEAVGIGIDFEKTIKQAFEETHRQSYLKELKERLEKGPVRSPLVFSLNEVKLYSIIEELALMIKSSPRDATIVLFEETGGYNIEPDDEGREVKVGASVEKVKAALLEGESVFQLQIAHAYPRVTEQLLRAQPPVHRLAAYTTYYGTHDSPNRIHNIKLIASWVEGTLLLSGETFSLSDVLGDVSPEQGFKEAYTIIGGELVPSLGGGACQVATTLYNAVSLADIKVLQRRNHSFYFNIYPLGRDAAVFPGQIDFKFVNDTGHPLLIKTVATNRRLSFRLYGTPTGKTVKFTSPKVELKTGEGYQPSTVEEVLAADAPFKTEVTRTVYDKAGKQIKEEVVRSSYKLYGEKSNVPIARPESR